MIIEVVTALSTEASSSKMVFFDCESAEWSSDDTTEARGVSAGRKILVQQLVDVSDGHSVRMCRYAPGVRLELAEPRTDLVFIVWRGTVVSDQMTYRPGSGVLKPPTQDVSCSAGPAGADVLEMRSSGVSAAPGGGPTSDDRLRSFDLEGTEEAPFTNGVGLTGNPLAAPIPAGQLRSGAVIANRDANDASVYTFRYGPGITVPLHHHDVDQTQIVLTGEMLMGARRLLSGQGVFTRSGTQYRFTTGPKGLRWLEFRGTKDWTTSYHDRHTEGQPQTTS